MLSVVVAIFCVSVYGFELGDESLHVLAGSGLLVALAFKVTVVRRWHAFGRFLPAIGITVFVLFALTWASSAGDFLADR